MGLVGHHDDILGVVEVPEGAPVGAFSTSSNFWIVVMTVRPMSGGQQVAQPPRCGGAFGLVDGRGAAERACDLAGRVACGR